MLGTRQHNNHSSPLRLNKRLALMLRSAGTACHNLRWSQIPIVFDDRFAFAANAIDVFGRQLLGHPVRVLRMAASAVEE